MRLLDVFANTDNYQKKNKLHIPKKYCCKDLLIRNFKLFLNKNLKRFTI